MVFALLRISVDFIEQIRVGQERAQAGLSAEIDNPAAGLGVWKICRIGIAEDPSAEGDKTLAFILLRKVFRHINIGARERLLYLACSLNFRNQHFKGTDRQSMGRF